MSRATAAFVVYPLICLTALTACRSYRPASETSGSIPGPGRESWNVHMYVTEADPADDHSVPRLELIAEYGVWIEERDTTYQRLTGVDQQVQVVLYDSTGTVAADIRADNVWYYSQTRRIIADGRVFIESSSGRTLTTEWVEWAEVSRTIRTNRHVVITSEHESLEGRGLIATEDLSQYQIGRFSAEVRVDS
ncbi:MAG: hypothetical protein OXI38_03165 [Bacteroidota bacterium]|nr:hypothetical protein [Bacteroidota bacterium]